jgi:hypothetical protein
MAKYIVSEGLLIRAIKLCYGEGTTLADIIDWPDEIIQLFPEPAEFVDKLMKVLAEVLCDYEAYTTGGDGVRRPLHDPTILDRGWGILAEIEAANKRKERIND